MMSVVTMNHVSMVEQHVKSGRLDVSNVLAIQVSSHNGKSISTTRTPMEAFAARESPDKQIAPPAFIIGNE